jgi:hypothetical protein
MYGLQRDARVALSVTVGILTILWGCYLTPRAEAFTSAELDAIAEHIYRGGASQIDPISCGTSCENLWDHEQVRLSDSPTTYALHRQLLEIRQRVSVLPDPESFHPELATGKSVASWRLGSGTNAKWLQLTIPPPATGVVGAITEGRMGWPRVVVASGFSNLSGDWELRTPFMGWKAWGAPAWGTVWPIYDDVHIYSPGYGIWPCIPSSDPSLVYAGWQILYGPPRKAQVNCGVDISQYQMPYSPLDVTDGDGPGSIEDFDSQSTTEPSIEYWADRPATFSSLRTRVGTELDGNPDRYGQLIPWYRALLDDPESDPSLDETPFLAERFRPSLRFDTGEPWRPLDVERFLEEAFDDSQPGDHHELCTSVASTRQCEPMDEASPAWQMLRDYRQGVGEDEKDDWPVIAVHGEGDDPDNFKSPRRGSCYHDGLNDCDAGSNTAVYYRASGPYLEANYQFLDYWMFFRFNKFDGGDHEADWEHMVVALPSGEANPETFGWVGLSGHSDSQFRYLRDVLRCDGDLSAGSCGSELGGATGDRVVAFVANGSHAIYPEPCSAPLGAATCERSTAGGTTLLPPEKGYDGERKWGADDDPTALRRWPDDPTAWDNVTSDLHWVNWPGRWGLKDDDSSVESPGAPTRDVFYEPWSWTCSERGTDESVNCDGGESLLRASAQGDEIKGSPCDAWAGPGVALTWCDEKALARGLRRGTVGVVAIEPDVHIGGRRRPAATSVGITQVGGGYVAPGQEVEIVPGAAIGGDLTIGIREGKSRVRATFSGDTLVTDGRLTRRLSTRIRRTTDGRFALERGNGLIRPERVERMSR